MPFAARIVRIALTIAHTRPAGHDRHLGLQGQPDCGDLAVGKSKTDSLLDPRQGLVGVNPGPGQCAVCQPLQAFGDDAFRPVKASEKDAGRFANLVAHHCSVPQLQLERGPDQLLRHLK